MYGLARQAVAVLDAVNEAIGHVADVDEVAFEVLFEDDQIAIGHGGEDEVIDEQIEPHARRQAENRRQPQA